MKILDLFCGAGGASAGIKMAAKWLGINAEIIGIDYNQKALDTHAANNSTATHICDSIDNIDPATLKWYGVEHIHASPSCRTHSVAKCSSIIDESDRSPAWKIIEFIRVLSPRSVTIENVPQFRNWGPIDSTGTQIPELKGQEFRKFVCCIADLGYDVKCQVLNCADYGDPTFRRRFFLIAKKSPAKVIFPAPTHFRKDQLALGERWRVAADIIDWANKGLPISQKNLADTTLMRIERGLRKMPPPFLTEYHGIQSEHEKRAASTVLPMPTIDTSGRFGLVQQFGELYFRMLTTAELAKAQSFPDDYKFLGSKEDILRQIGNSVPIMTAAHVAFAAIK